MTTRSTQSESERMRDIASVALADAKGVEVRALDVRGLTDITDFMVIASGNSDRHVRALSERVRESMRERGHRPIGIEGELDSDWVLLDFGDVVVHVMRPATRDFYDIEGLWSEDMAALVRAHREGRME